MENALDQVVPEYLNHTNEDENNQLIFCDVSLQILQEKVETRKNLLHEFQSFEEEIDGKCSESKKLKSFIDIYLTDPSVIHEPQNDPNSHLEIAK